MSFSPVFWWRLCQIREHLWYCSFQGLKQHTANAGSGGRSHGTVGRAVSRQPLLPLDEGRKAAVMHHSSQPLPERPAWDAASLRPCPEQPSNNDRSGKAPQKSEQPSSADRQLSFHLTPTLEAEELQQSPAASAQHLARAHAQEAPADEHHHRLPGQGLTAEHVSEAAQPLSLCPPSLCAPFYDRPEAEQAAPREQAAVPTPANCENSTQMAGVGTAAGLSPSSIARDLPATEVQERPTQLPMVLCTLLEALPAGGGEACPAQLPEPQAMTVPTQSAGGAAMPCAAQVAEGAAAPAEIERPCSARSSTPQALGVKSQGAHCSDMPCAAEMGEAASVPMEEACPCPGQLPEPQALAVQAQVQDSNDMQGAPERAEAAAVVPEDEMSGPAPLPAPQQLVAHRQDAGNRATPGPVQDGKAAELHADEDRACPAQLPAPQCLAMQSQGSDGNTAPGGRQDDAAGKPQEECGAQAEPQKAAEKQPLRSGHDAATEGVQPGVQGLTSQQAGKQGGSSSTGDIGSGGAQEAMAEAAHEGSRPSSPLPPAEPPLHAPPASLLSAGQEVAAPAEIPAESPKALLSPALAVAAASVLLSVQVGSNSSSLSWLSVETWEHL